MLPKSPALERYLEAYKSERRQRRAKEVCYFVQRERDSLIKIGYTSNLSARLIGLETEAKSPVKLLGVMKGGVRLESMLHSTFSALRVEGEWFTPKAALLQYIAENTARERAIMTDEKRPPRVKKSRLSDIEKARRKEAKRQARKEILITKLSHPKPYVRRRTASTLMYEYREEAIPIYEAHRTQADRELRQWFDLCIDLIHKYPTKPEQLPLAI